MAMNSLCSTTAIGLAGLIRTRQVSARAVIEAHLERIEQVNPTINAISKVLTEEALTAADLLDRDLANGIEPGALAGVPFTVKDNIDVQGSATTWGVRAHADQIASEDSPMVRHLRNAGAIPIARTNMCDFASRWHTESDLIGHTLNPWDLTRSPGGSSGGDAAALATGMTPLGLGNDLGGSLRVPSQLCGTTALRPTAGRIADAACTEPGIGPISMQLLNCQGPMARNVADLRAAFSILCQPDIRDPRHIPLPADAHGRNIYRVAFVRDPLGMGVEPGVAAGVSLAADWFSDAGLEVVETEPPLLADAVALWNQLAGADWPSRWQEFEPLSGEALRQCVQAENVRAIDQDEQRQALIARHMIGQAWARFSEAFPVLLAPVCAEPAWPLGDDIRRGEGFPETMRMLLPANALGLPSCAVPVGLANGLPQGVQLIGARFSEMLLLDAAQVIEDRVGPALTPIDPVRR
jgi:amidase